MLFLICNNSKSKSRFALVVKLICVFTGVGEIDKFGLCFHVCLPKNKKYKKSLVRKKLTVS